MGRFSSLIESGKREEKPGRFSDLIVDPGPSEGSGTAAQKRIQKSNVAVQRGASFAALKEASTIQDPVTRIGVFAKHRGIGTERYRVSRSGDIEYQDDSGQWFKEEPKQSWLKRMAAGTIGAGPEEAATAVGGVLGGVPGAAGAAFLASEARNVYNKIRYNENQNVLTYTVKPAIDTATAAIGGTSAKGGVLAYRRAQRVGTGPVGKLVAPEVKEGLIDPVASRAAAQSLEKEGITPTLTEATGSRTLQGVEAYQRGLASKAGYLYRAQDKVRGEQIKAAVGRKLETISPVSSQLEAGEMAISSVKDIENHILSQARQVEGVTITKKPLVSKLYKKAYEEAGNTAINTKPVLDEIEKIMETASGTTATAMRKMRNDLLMKTGDPKKQLLKSGMPEVDAYYKQTVNNLYKKAKAAGDAAAPEIGKVRRILLDEIGKVSKSYKLARTVTRGFYSRLERFQESTLGKMVYRNEGKPHKLAAELFGPNSSTKIVKEAAEVLPEKDMQALAKAVFIDKWSKTAGAGPATAGEKFARMVSTEPGFMDKMKVVLPDDQYKAMKIFTEDVLPLTKQVISTDVSKTEGLGVMKTRLGGVKARVALALNLTPYGINRNLQDFATGKYADKIAEQILSKDGLEKVLRLKQVGKNTEKLIIGLFSMIGVGTLGTQQQYAGGRLVPVPPHRADRRR